MNRPVRHSLVFGLGLLMGLLQPFTVRSAEHIYTFTDIQGRSFDGSVMAFDPDEQLVTIRRTDGKTGKMALSRFSEKDGRYISNWVATNDFMNAVGITVKLASDGVQPVDGSGVEQVADFHYRILVRNESASNFGKVAVEYCIFYRQGERNGNTIHYDEGTCYGKAMVALDSKSSVILKTKDVRLYSQSGLSTLFGLSENLSDAEIRGIWLRFKTKPPLGAEVVREHRTSDDERWTWATYSIAAGRNPGQRGSFKYDWQ